jgi:hypothetical protein
MTDRLRNGHLSPRELAIALFVPGIYIVAIIRYIHRAGSPLIQPWRAIVLLSIVGIALFVSIVNAATSARLSTVSLPAFIVAFWLVDSHRRMNKAARQAIGAAVVLLMMRDIQFAQRTWTAYVNTPSGRVALSSTDRNGRYYSWLARNTNPGEYVFDASSSEIYYWFELNNPTTLWGLSSCEFTRPAQVAEVVRDLARREVRLIIWNHRIDDMGCPAASDHLQPVRDYMRQHYRLSETFPENGVTIWERVVSVHG